MEASIRSLAKKRAALDSESDEEINEKKKKGQGALLLQAEIAKYKTRTIERDRDGKKKRRDETDLITKLNSFKGSLQDLPYDDEDEEMKETGNEEGEQISSLPLYANNKGY